MVRRRELAPIKLLGYSIGNYAEQANSILDSLPIKIKRLMLILKASEIEVIKKEVIKVKNAASKIRIDWDRFEDIN